MSWMEEKLSKVKSREAFVATDGTVSYGELLEKIENWKEYLSANEINKNHTVAVISDYSPESTALLFALLSKYVAIVPLTVETRSKHERFFKLAGVTHIIEQDAKSKRWQLTENYCDNVPELVGRLHDESDAGFILFTSGTSGESKGAVLSARRMMERFEQMVPDGDKSLRCMVFLKLDHIGGINTLFSILFSGGTAVSIRDRSVQEVCECVEKHCIQLLPTTPTFLNMLLLSGAHEQYGLSSLKIITYGTEPMPMSTLKAVHKVFPHVKLKQTYGLTELGIFSTKSKSSDSDWMKIGGKGVEIKIENEILFIRAKSAMLGYLNADSPFTDDGWYNTGDRVEVDGEYLRILGRESEIINVGGEKVYPAEVESVLLEMPNVKEVIIKGKSNPVTGNIVTAVFVLEKEEDRKTLLYRVHEFCKDKLEPYKMPKIVGISKSSFMGDRMKKARSSVVV